MPRASVLVPDTGTKKAHFYQRTYPVIGDALDEWVIPGEYPYPSHIIPAHNIATTTAGDHLLAIAAGATLPVRVRSIRVTQVGNATTAAVKLIEIFRTITTAPSGGGVVTIATLDTTDVVGCTARTLPTTKGVESTLVWPVVLPFRQAVLATSAQEDQVWKWKQKPGQKPLIIPAGVTNGLAFKNTAATAGASINIIVEVVETDFV